MDLLQIKTREDFCGYWTNILLQGKIMPLEYAENFLENSHHGLDHAANVWEKTEEIIRKIPEPIRREVTIAGAGLHDIGRSDPDDKQFDNHHIISAEICWRFIEHYAPNMPQKDQQDLSDAVSNHDFWNREISQGRMFMPRSLEGKILRAGDRMSFNDLRKEIRRYWLCGKDYGDGQIFKIETSLDFRLNWTPAQYADPETDPLCCYFMMLVFKPEDMGHPVLEKIYTEWEKGKPEAVDEIIKIAEEECPFKSPVLKKNYLDALRMTIYSFKKAKGLTW